MQFPFHIGGYVCFREIKHLVQCHIAGNGQNQDISSCRTDSTPAFLNTRLLASYAFLFYSGHIFLVNYGAQLILG